MHSKARVAIEHTFGSLKGRWRILKYIDVYSISKVTDIITACCILHNFCLINNEVSLDIDYDIEEDSDFYEASEFHVSNAGTEKRNTICNRL